MWADSEPGRCSTFFFTAHFEVSVNRFRGLRALIVDDNSTSRRLLGLMLEDWRIEAVCAAGAQEALKELQRTRNSEKSFDVVVLDSEMPGMDGFELARWIDADSPRIMRFLRRVGGAAPQRRLSWGSRQMLQNRFLRANY
jgi:two-component system, sensor histidine kinase and response regulator